MSNTVKIWPEQTGTTSGNVKIWPANGTGSDGVGTSGYSGYSGSSTGTSGYSGISGYSGVSGCSGVGIDGISGYSGMIGISGYSGYSGAGFSGFPDNYVWNETTAVMPDPSLYNNGDEWTDNATLIVYKLYDDGIQKIWVETCVAGISGYSGVSGYSGYSGVGESGYSGYSGVAYAATFVQSTITSSGWSGNQQSVGVSGITGTNEISWSPSTLADSVLAGQANLFCSAQSIDSLTFQCNTSPASDINIIVTIR